MTALPGCSTAEAVVGIARLGERMRAEPRFSSRRLIALRPVGDQAAPMTDPYESTEIRRPLREADISTPPNEALDRLAKVRCSLDEQIAVLIGRLGPYQSRAVTAEGIMASTAAPRSDEMSAHEERIEDEIEKLQELDRQVGALLSSIRL